MNLNVNPMTFAGFISSIELKGDQWLSTFMEELERKEPGGEGVGGEGGADGELGGQVGDQVVGQNREILDGLFRSRRDETEAGVNGGN